MRRKTLLTLYTFAFLTIGAALLNSCRISDDCGGSWTVFEPINFSVMPLEITGTCSTGELYEVATYTNQTLAYDHIGLKMTYDLQELMSAATGLSFINNAYACSPIPPYDYFNNFTVISDTDYDENHPAGTDLSGLLVFSTDLSTRALDGVGFAELSGHDFLIRFSSPPSNASTHTLRIQFGLDRGEAQNLNVAPLSITP